MTDERNSTMPEYHYEGIYCRKAWLDSRRQDTMLYRCTVQVYSGDTNDAWLPDKVMKIIDALKLFLINYNALFDW